MKPVRKIKHAVLALAIACCLTPVLASAPFAAHAQPGPCTTCAPALETPTPPLEITPIKGPHKTGY